MKRTILMIFTAISICLSGMEAFAITAADNNATVEMTRAEKRKAKKAAKAAEKLRKEKEKQEKKRQQERLDSLQFEMALAAIDDMHFVIVADRVRFRRGYTVNVNQSTNFVLVQGNEATVQLAFERGFSGPNGLGGITVEGRITNVEKRFDKKGNLLYRMMVTGTAISADISFTLPKNGTSCNVTVNSNFYPVRITFSGELKPYNTNVFQGRTIR